MFTSAVWRWLSGRLPSSWVSRLPRSSTVRSRHQVAPPPLTSCDRRCDSTNLMEDVLLHRGRRVLPHAFAHVPLRECVSLRSRAATDTVCSNPRRATTATPSTTLTWALSSTSRAPKRPRLARPRARRTSTTSTSSRLQAPVAQHLQSPRRRLSFKVSSYICRCFSPSLLMRMDAHRAQAVRRSQVGRAVLARLDPPLESHPIASLGVGCSSLRHQRRSFRCASLLALVRFVCRLLISFRHHTTCRAAQSGARDHASHPICSAPLRV